MIYCELCNFVQRVITAPAQTALILCSLELILLG
jgi:hypothetical protein